ncbi:MAG: PaaI family thioesterase [Alistipes sp.]|nr:PaaI family thioesterase [Alistipes sp.]
MRKVINPWIHEEGYHCFGCDPTHEHGLRMEFYEDGDEIVSRWRPTGEHQSWVDRLHGGVQAALLDELCGWVIFRKFQSGGVTSRMDIRYRKPVVISEGDLILRASVAQQRRNVIDVVGRIYNAAGELCTEATCIYFLFPKSASGEQMPTCECHVEDEEVESI